MKATYEKPLCVICVIDLDVVTTSGFIEPATNNDPFDPDY